jgi:DNA-binding transcriptional LysR family regulator
MAQDMDWNLLPILDVLLTENSVTAAAERLHLSVPATSRALGRIRRTFDDPILVRAGRGVVPTERARAIQQRLHELVEDTHAILELGRSVDMTSVERTFTIRANDALIGVLATGLIPRAAASAPHVALRFVPEGDEDLGPLRDGTVDLDVGVIADLGPEVHTEPLYEERLVGMIAPGHQLAARRVTLRKLSAMDHVVVSRRGRRSGALDEALSASGLERRVVAIVPTFTAAADIITASQLTGLVPSRYATQVSAATGAHLYDIPATLPLMPISQAWHGRHDRDPAHQWLRQQVAATLADKPVA